MSAASHDMVLGPTGTSAAAPAACPPDPNRARSDTARDEPGAARTRLDRIGDIVARVLLWLTAIAMVASVVTVVVQIVFRYWLRKPFLGGEGLESIAFTWITFLSLPRAIWFDTAPRIGIVRHLRGPAARVLSGVQVGASLGFVVVAIWSYSLLAAVQAATQITTLGVPDNVKGFAVVVGAALMGLALLVRSRRQLLGLPLVGALAGFVGTVAIIHSAGHPRIAGLVLLVVLIVLDTPIAIALGLAGCVLVIQGDWSQASIPAQQLLEPMQNVALLAIPLFLLMGGFVAATRLAADLSRFVHALLGWFPGGTALACIATGAVFANISGSAIADTAAVGTIYIPELKRRGYPVAEASALQAAAGVVGVVFPPAIAMILFSSVANIPVVPVFEAVIVPGLLLVVVMAVIAMLHARRVEGIREHVQQFSGRELGRSVPRALAVLCIPFILDGGILSGIFSPAESGAVAIVVTVLLIALFSRRSLRSLGAGFTQAVDSTATVMAILTSVSIIDYGFSISGVSEQVTGLLSHFEGSPLMMLLIINLVFVVVHEFVDVGPTILVLVPLILASSQAAGISLLQLAVVIAINSTIGAVLPPVGVSLYVSAAIGGVDARLLLGPIMKFVFGSALVLIIVTLWPSLSTWLPGRL